MRRSRRVTLVALVAVAAVVLASCEVGMGSAGNRLGQDPERIDAVVPLDGTGYWLNIDGPATGKTQGDRFTSNWAPLGCNPTCTYGPNPEYDPSGAWYRVHVNTVRPGEPLTVDAFDPAFVETGDFCSTPWTSTLFYTEVQRAQIVAAYGADPLAADRYAFGPGPFCTGDAGGESAGPAPITTYVVRQPDSTPLDDTDNPVVCASSFSPRTGSLFSLLVAGGAPATTPVGALDQLPLGAVFRQHVPICTVPAGSVVAGTYLVQVRTNASQPGVLPRTVVADPSIDAQARATVLQNDTSGPTEGHNRFALRAGWGDDPGATGSGEDVWTSAANRLTAYIVRPPGSPAVEVPVYRAPSYLHGRVVHLEAYDLADGPASAGTISIALPAERTGGEPTCTWSLDGGPLPASLATAGCTLSGTFDAGTFNNAVLGIDIAFTADYGCADSVISGCSVAAEIDIPGTVRNDTSTWTAAVV